MADSLDDGEFWLPAEFLTDDDIQSDNRTVFPNCFGPFGAVGASSAHSSPVESVIGSSETESDEEEYIADLSQRMAHSTLENKFASGNAKSQFISGSPQSTLYSVNSFCGRKRESDLDLLQATAGEVARMRLNEERFRLLQSRSGLPKPTTNTLSPATVNVKRSIPDVEFYNYQQLQASQYEVLRKQQIVHHLQHQQMIQMVRNGGRINGGVPGVRNSVSEGFSSDAWTSPLQQAQNQPHLHGSGMRAVFLESSRRKRDSVGTGVFLPRQIGTQGQSESRKKPSCSNVLVPARVMHALNLNMDNMQYQPHHSGPQYDRLLKLRNNGESVASHNLLIQPLNPVIPMKHKDLRLPREWTY